MLQNQLKLNWQSRDQPILQWLNDFPPERWEVVVKEVLKDYILFGEATNPIPTVDLLKSPLQAARLAAAQEPAGTTGQMGQHPKEEEVIPLPSIVGEPSKTSPPVLSRQEAEAKLKDFLTNF